MSNSHDENSPWIHQLFLKDKLRYQERYNHPFQTVDLECNIRDDNSIQLFLVPNGMFLRKYLTFWEELVSIILASYLNYDNERHKLLAMHQNQALKRSDLKTFIPITLLLLESSAEAMDVQNSHNGETANPHERDRVAKLYLKARQQHSISYANSPSTDKNSIKRYLNKAVDIFTDLSYRCEEDEMDLFEYTKMGTLVRSQYALLRAGRILLQEKSRNNCNRSKRQILLLSADMNNVHQGTTTADSIQNPPNMRFLSSINELLQLLCYEYKCIKKTQYDHLYDLCRVCENTYEIRNSKSHSIPSSISSSSAQMEKIWTIDEIQNALKNKTLHKGILSIPKRYKGEVSVTISKVKYYIADPNKIRALPGDTVAIQILPQSKWESAPIGTCKLLQSPSSNRDDQEEKDEYDSDDNNDIRPLAPTAKVIKILIATGRRNIVATFQQKDQNQHSKSQNEVDVKSPLQGGGDMVLVTPMDLRYPKVRISGKNRQQWANKRIIIQIDSWNTDDNYANGHFVQMIGPVGDLETEITSLLFENELKMIPFSMSAMACLPAIDEGEEWSIPPEEIEKRKDLRSIPDMYIYSVDPPGCQDIDDTMHARVLPNGDIEVGVHIADVDYFVPQGCALDKEAAAKATTFYLVDRRFDMLPSLLSSDLCSLHGGKDRLAVSVIWMFDENWERKSIWMGKTIIHNCQAMTYEQAHNILHSRPPDPTSPLEVPPLTAGAPVSPHLIPSLLKSLKLLTKLARFRKKYREKIGGAIDLSSASPELKFELDNNGNPIRVSPKEDKEIHHTIAEMMIMANQSVAEKIHNVYPAISLLRVHKTIDKDTSEIDEIIRDCGIRLNKNKNEKSGQNLASSLQRIKDVEPHKDITSYVQSIATRLLSEAEYICTGTAPEEGWRHYGLGINKYTHFTSPIRRYADVIVHRLLMASIICGIKEDANLMPVSVNKHCNSQPQQTQILIPKSSALSVLKGERRKKFVDDDDNDDDFLDSLVGDVSDMALSTDILGISNDNNGLWQQKQKTRLKIYENNDMSPDPYKTGEVALICEHLNHQHRMAKIASMECQSLFLSLYFQENVDIASAIITGLRTNGLLVYIPKYDLKVPVFLSDKNGGVSIDPSLLGLDPSNGLPPSIAFSAVKENRHFPDGKCELTEIHDQNDKLNAKKALKVMIPGAPKDCMLMQFDVIRVQLSCNTSDSNARVPLPRIHMVYPRRDKYDDSNNIVKNSVPTKVTSKSIHNKQNHNGFAESKPENLLSVSKAQTPISMNKIIHSFKIVPSLPFSDKNSHIKNHGDPSKPDRAQPIQGRFIYNSFQNPDTHSASQKAAAELAMKNQDVQALDLQRAQPKSLHEYDQSKRVEREVTVRIQRRAMEKRNTRRSKSGK